MDRFLSENGINSFENILDAFVLAGAPIGHAIDGGAGAGHTAKRIVARLASNERCFAFEPFEGNHRFFQDLDKRIVLHKEALAEKSKVSSFAVSSSVTAESEWGKRGMVGYSSVGKLVDAPTATQSAQEVVCVAADDVIPRDHAVGFIKLDLQGGELNALKGMQQILKSVKVMWVEFSNQPGLLDFLRASDFHIFDTEYMFTTEPTAAMKRDFLFSKGEGKLSTGKAVWFGFPQVDWTDYGRQIDLMKYKYGLVQTDLVCVPKSQVAAFKAMILKHLGSTAAGVKSQDKPLAATEPAAEQPQKYATATDVGTDSEAWRIMSAHIAYVLWSSPARKQQPSEQGLEHLTWDVRSSGYRANVRHALRMMEGEGFRLRADEVNVLLPSSKDWWAQTARLAWLLWLRTNREFGRVPAEKELEVWATEAEAYRTYVRDAIKTLSADGILLQA